MLRTVTAMRYVTPLREGGSLPAIVEADDGRLYVCKFLGAGHGAKALLAELLAGEIGRALGLRVPELVFIDMPAALSLTEPDAEIYDLLKASIGLNLGMAFLPEALSYNPLARPTPDPDEASAIVWFDAYTANVDRTPRNVNMLVWQEQLWCIDHGSALYYHHNWGDHLKRSQDRFA